MDFSCVVGDCELVFYSFFAVLEVHLVVVAW
jgi:hypothetical protein